MSQEDECQILHFWTALSYATFAVCLLIGCVSTLTNLILLIALIRRSRLKKNFYIIMANIVISDMIAGAVIAPISADLHRQEALYHHLTGIEADIFKFGIIFLGIVAILSMAVFSADRMLSLLRPIAYAHFGRQKVLMLLAIVWIVTFSSSTISFYVDFMVLLPTFATVATIITAAAMFTTLRIYRRKMTRPTTRGFFLSQTTRQRSVTAGSESPTQTEDHRPFSANKQFDQQANRNTCLEPNVYLETGVTHLSLMERRATNTFIIILLIFLLSYFPVVLMGIYINLCTKCNCLLVHICRDMIIMFILGSSSVRALTFLIRLTALRREVKLLFKLH